MLPASSPRTFEIPTLSVGLVLSRNPTSQLVTPGVTPREFRRHKADRLRCKPPRLIVHKHFRSGKLQSYFDRLSFPGSKPLRKRGFGYPCARHINPAFKFQRPLPDICRRSIREHLFTNRIGDHHTSVKRMQKLNPLHPNKVVEDTRVHDNNHPRSDSRRSRSL